jgi:hypothetical protein
MLTRPAPDEARQHCVGTSMIQPFRQTSSATKDDSLPLVDGHGTVVRFPTPSRKQSGLRGWGGTGKSDIIHLRPRRPASRRHSDLTERDTTSKSLIEHFERYQYPTDTDDHDDRHRMSVNVLAAVVLILLMIIGEWAVNTLVKVT